MLDMSDLERTGPLQSSSEDRSSSDVPASALGSDLAISTLRSSSGRFLVPSILTKGPGSCGGKSPLTHALL